MKKIAFIIFVYWIIPVVVFGQLKNQDNPVNIKSEIVKSNVNNSLLLGLINPSRITMSHSYSMSYFSIGGKGISQSLYLNTLKYQISDPLWLKVQWGIRNYPYNSFAKDHPAFDSGLFFSGAELNYKPSDKFYLKFQYNNLPYLNNYYRNPYRHSYFWDDED